MNGISFEEYELDSMGTYSYVAIFIRYLFKKYMNETLDEFPKSIFQLYKGHKRFRIIPIEKEVENEKSTNI